MRIKSVYIKNFRGIKALNIDCNGKDIVLTGPNGAGKTSFFNAITWCLFNKIFEFNNEITKFEIQNLSNQDMETIVEIQFQDGLKLKKINKLRANKKNGTIEVVRDSNPNEYFVNDLPKKMSEYKKSVNQIVDEKVFKMLSNPLFFNTLSSAEKRKMITEILEIDNSNLNNLYDTVNYKKSNLAKLKEKVNEINTRIDENEKKLAEENLNMDEKVIKVDIENLEKELEKIKDTKSEKIVKINDLNNRNNLKLTKLIEEKSELESQKIDSLEKNSNFDKLQKELSSLENYKEKLQKSLNNGIEELSKLREKYKIAYATKFKLDESLTVCPQCRQELPYEDKKSLIKDLETKFYKKRSVDIININDQGIELSKKNESIKENISKIEKKCENISNEIKNFSLIDISKIEGKINDINNNIAETKKDIEDIVNENQKDDNLENDINNIKDKLKEKNNNLSLILNTNSIKNRIEELKNERKQQSKHYSNIQSEIFNLDKKIEEIMNKILKKSKEIFPSSINFQLFETQKNGGMKEKFDILYNNKPYMLPLSQGEKIFVGLILIKVLQKYYNVEIPVFIDNYESLTKKTSLECQKIFLVCKDIEGLEIDIK